MTLSDTPRPELLAPAGGPEALRAAVNNGADAVYLGVDRLNARQGAENFTMESLPDATRYAHLRGARVYLTANVVVLQDEMHDALVMVDEAWSAGVDAVIVQDLGLLALLRSELPHVRVHASTQINAHNTPSARLLGELGVSRVTLARETSIPEIATISAGAGVEIESFVHGAICICYSGQCLMSSMIGGRSANRGQCAQPCRLAYELLDEKGKLRTTPGPHLLSPKDLCGIEALPALVATGVSALKIEGRMKSPEYVALVTGVYRSALDRALADPAGFEVTEAERDILSEAFSRGFTQAYMAEERGRDMMSYARPNNRGVPVGRVARVADGEAVVSLDAALDSGDTVEFWTGRGRFAQKVGQLLLKGRPVAVGPAGEKVALRPEKPVAQGDRLFRVANARLDEAARRTFSETASDAAGHLDVAVRLVVGEPLEVSVRMGEFGGSARGDIVEEARTKPVTTEEVTDHVGRFGGTAFVAGSWDVTLSPGAGIGFSALHRARREAVEALEAAILEPWSGREAEAPSEPSPPRRRNPRTEVPELVIRTSDPATARACLAAGAQRAILPSWLLAEEPDPPRGTVLEVSRIAHDREVDDLVKAAHRFDRVACGNLGLLPLLSDADRVVETHAGLNPTNPWTVEVLSGLGAGFVWLSPELSGRQMAGIVRASTAPVGVSIYGRQEVMVTEHCVLMSIGPCAQVCGTCPRRQGWHALRDAKGYSFPVVTDPMGRSHIHNSVPLDLTRALPELIEAGVDAVCLDFTVEHQQEAQHITRLAREAIVAAVSGKPAEDAKLARSTTTGQFYRGLR